MTMPWKTERKNQEEIVMDILYLSLYMKFKPVSSHRYKCWNAKSAGQTSDEEEKK